MDKINDLQGKIQDLQTRINATQAQINDYKTNPKYRITKKEVREVWGGGAELQWVTYNTKQTELTQAQNTLKSLQNQLTTTQAELDSLIKMQKEQQAELEKQQAQKQAHLARLIAQCSTPPPSTDLVAIKRILESLNNLQSKLLSI